MCERAGYKETFNRLTIREEEEGEDRGAGVCVWGGVGGGRVWFQRAQCPFKTEDISCLKARFLKSH